MNDIVYPYIGNDPVENRHSYAYVPFMGTRYLDAWREARREVSRRIGDTPASIPEGKRGSYPSDDLVDTEALIEQLVYDYQQSEIGGLQVSWLRWLIQRFEVSKRVFTSYRLVEGRPKGRGGYRDMRLYLRFAELMTLSYVHNRTLPSLNALLKCLDTVCSYVDELGSEDRGRLVRLLQEEEKLVDAVSLNRGHEPPSGAQPNEGEFPKIRTHLDGAVLLAADTVRSRAYAQALVAAGVTLDAVLLVTSEGKTRWGQSRELSPPPESNTLPGLFVPDLRVPLDQTCSLVADRVDVIPAGTINSSSVESKLRSLSPKLVIYSGFGGELVHSNILEAAGPFLHMHAGWLPNYRGSTTIYYSILDRSGCGVSAILLTPEIDGGQIALRRWYPAPSPDIELDYYYDGVVRSDVLLGVLSEYASKQALPELLPQNLSEGETYYIIHPVLKHLSIIKLHN